MFKKIYRSLYVGTIEIVLGASTYLILHILNIPSPFLIEVFALAFVAIGVIKLSCWKTGYEMDNLEADDIEKAKRELLSDEKIKLPKWVIFISIMSSLTTRPIAILAYLPVFGSVIQTLVEVKFNPLDSLFAVLTSMCLLVLLTSIKMKKMNKDGVLDLYLSSIFEKEAFPRFLKSKFQKGQS